MRSRFRVGVVLVALTAQLFAPIAAYASTTALPGFGDFCSANRNVTAVPGSAPALPRPFSPKHGSSHCAFCSASASAAVLPSAPALPAPGPQAEASLCPTTRMPVAVASVLLPPTRGPPVAS